MIETSVSQIEARALPAQAGPRIEAPGGGVGREQVRGPLASTDNTVSLILGFEDRCCVPGSTCTD